MNISSYRLNIADLLISVEASSGVVLKITDIYRNFITTSDNDPDIYIKVYAKNPDLSSTINCIFSSTDGNFLHSDLYTPYIWNIYKDKDQGIIKITQRGVSAEIFAIIIFNEQWNKWKIFFPYAEQKIDPLKYPIGPLIMYYITNINKGIMLHASAMMHKTKGLVFTGFSGAGKTTMALLWKNYGSIVNDDRIIIRKIKSKLYIYNTPLYANDIPRKAELSKIFIIRHSSKNQLKRINGASALTRTLALCIQHNYDKKLIERMVDVLEAIVNKIPVYDLGFVPDEKIIDFILKNESIL